MRAEKNKIIAGHSERTFMTGVLVLSASTVTVKIIGLAYKIPLLSILGAEGMGYFNSAYEIYAMLCVISTAGLPVAISILISGALERGDLAGAAHIRRVSLCAMLGLGFLGSSALCALARPISYAIGNPNAYFCILAVSPALLFACASCAVRGYFQGRRNMLPSAVSQLIEALGKLLLGVAFAAFAKSRGYSVPVAAAFAVLGLVLGGLASVLYLLSVEFIDSGRAKDLHERPTADHRVLSGLLKIAFPITLGAAMLGITRIIDMALIMRRLQDLGISSSAANEIYGSYTTLAIPVFSLVPALVTPISESLVPRLSAAREATDTLEQRAAVEKAIRLTVLPAMPSSMGIMLYAEQILGLIFKGQSEAISTAAPLLAVLGASVLFSCLISTTNAILHAYRRVMLPIASMAIGAAVKCASAYLLIGNAGVGELGAPVGTLLCNLVVVGANMYFLDRAVPEGTATARLLARPFFASVAAVTLSLAAYLPLIDIVGESVAFIAAMVCACIFYAVLAFLLGAVNAEDISSLPLIDKLLEKNKKNYKKGAKK